MSSKQVEVGSKVEVTFGQIRWFSGTVVRIDSDDIMVTVQLEDGRVFFFRTDCTRGLVCCRVTDETVKRVRIAA